jgi:hypothetical protein
MQIILLLTMMGGREFLLNNLNQKCFNLACAHRKRKLSKHGSKDDNYIITKMLHCLPFHYKKLRAKVTLI